MPPDTIARGGMLITLETVVAREVSIILIRAGNAQVTWGDGAILPMYFMRCPILR